MTCCLNVINNRFSKSHIPKIFLDADRTERQTGGTVFVRVVGRQVAARNHS